MALQNTLWIPKNNEYEAIHIDNILYCESKNYLTLFHITTEEKNLTTIVSSRGIGEWEKELEVHQFYRIHSQLLVNIKHIKRFINRKEGVVILPNDIKLSVSKSKKQKFMEYIGIK